WWGSTWTRTSFYGNAGSDDLTKCLDFLPDFKTESTGATGIPTLLQTKWGQETTGFADWINPSAVSLRTNLNVAPAQYLTKWLAAWVKEFGIDGFRVDTAKHVDMFRWAALKTECSTAYDQWRAANPTKAEKIPLPVGKTKGSFWMTGEVWGHGPNKSNYHTDGNFDSVINFSFPKDGNLSSIGSTWSGYASSINSDPDFNVLSYISSHDQGLTRGNLKNLGTALVLTPGGAQIYYGDESGRPFGDTGSDTYQGTRSDMNWSSMDNDALAHWQKLGKFRNRHIAVGGGSQTDLGSNTYGRVYSKNSISDKVVIAISQTGSVQVNVSGVFADGTSVKNYYDGATGTVSGGKVTFSAGTNGVILIEENK
ncbi:MAG TPA: alpha-amylase family glycosyl hydrolase, partial [Spirochaetota bacterium]|nr:alpha-amylase family glycosyl hydrolase [Spirochaetota bacterium]